MIKKVIKIVLGLFALIAAGAAIGGSRSSKKAKEIKEDIKDNEDKEKDIQKEIRDITRQKDEFVIKINKGEEEINTLKDKKPNVKNKSVEDAKKSLKDRLDG